MIDFQHGMWDLCWESRGKYLRLSKEVVLISVVCRKLGGGDKGLK